MNKGPSERPTSPDIPTPSLYLGVAIVVSVGRFCMNKTNHSEHTKYYGVYFSDSCPSVSGRNRE